MSLIIIHEDWKLESRFIAESARMKKSIVNWEINYCIKRNNFIEKTPESWIEPFLKINVKFNQNFRFNCKNILG